MQLYYDTATNENYAFNPDVVVTPNAPGGGFTFTSAKGVVLGPFPATLVAGTAPVIAPTLTLAQQAVALIAGGLTITSTSTPALNGVYACDDAAQAKLSRVYGLIQRASGAFPAGLTSLPWTDKSGAPHVFPTVAQFLALETAVGDFVLACELVIATNSGTLPPAAATIP